MTDQDNNETERQTGRRPHDLVQDDTAFRLWLMDTLMDIKSNHAKCRTELNSKIDDVDKRTSTLEGYLKKAVIIGIALVSSGAAGSELIKKLLEVVSQ